MSARLNTIRLTSVICSGPKVGEIQRLDEENKGDILDGEGVYHPATCPWAFCRWLGSDPANMVIGSGETSTELQMLDEDNQVKKTSGSSQKMKIMILMMLHWV